ncbi:Hypothetical predicted protein [Cloeon dipterum]|uniref:Uncharacterized protein n=1 Tax=Cloeon dipterum TaxID=197152 RepID=A0A8S1D0R9_9INSE|nr:Hypothetical predicted protein [Cloeon dipterum]CAB3380415.1 Hypothetical predicted protein [Cloeon dipterum]
MFNRPSKDAVNRVNQRSVPTHGLCDINATRFKLRGLKLSDPRHIIIERMSGLYTLAETDQAEEVKTVIDGKSCQHDGFQPALNLCRIFQSRVCWC